MLDTDLIIVENIKATILNIKEWVLNLYPFTYIAGSKKFIIKNAFDGRDCLMLENDGTKESTTLNENTEIDAGIKLTSSELRNYLDGDTFEVETFDGSNSIRTYDFKAGTSNSEISITDDELAIKGISGVNALVDVNGIHLTADNKVLLDGRLNIGYSYDQQSDDGAEFNKAKQITIGNGELNDIVYPMGTTLQNSNADANVPANIAYSTSTMSLIADKKLEVTEGIWLVTASVYTINKFADNKRLGFQLACDGVLDPVSERLLPSYGNSRMQASTSGTFKVGTGTHNIQVYARQTSGASAEPAYVAISACRIG